jgi:hypothetical protein
MWWRPWFWRGGEQRGRSKEGEKGEEGGGRGRKRKREEEEEQGGTGWKSRTGGARIKEEGGKEGGEEIAYHGC